MNRRERKEKTHYRIGKVAQMLNVPAYVLRYWESEFPELRPKKTDSGQREYTDEDIEVLKKIIRLRYDEKLTVSGARNKMSSSERTIPEPDLRRTLREIKICLQGILSELR